MDKIFAKEKKKVAPNEYNTDEAYKQKVYGVYLGNNKSPKDGLVGEIVYLSNQTPCSNLYNLDQTPLSKIRKIPIANMKRDMTVRSPGPSKEVRNSPSPHSYPDQPWQTLSHKASIPKFSIAKEVKQGRFLDSHVKREKYKPGPGTYKGNGIE